MRSPEAARDLERLVPGLRAFAFDGGEGEGEGGESAASDSIGEALRESSCVFSTVPPTKREEEEDEEEGRVVNTDPDPSHPVDPVLAAHGTDIFSKNSNARFVGYVSSTSVYGGDLGGAQVDERSPAPGPEGSAAGALSATSGR